MMSYKFGNIIPVPFPFTDQSSSKKRPAVIISSNLYNKNKPDLIIMAITSQITLPLKLGEYQILDFASVGLLKPSVIKPIISTVAKNLEPECIKDTRPYLAFLRETLLHKLSSNYGSSLKGNDCPF